MSRLQQCQAETGARQEALERVEQLKTAVMRVLEVLHSVQAFLEVTPRTTREEFRRFVMPALGRCPELQALEWIPRVGSEQREQYETRAQTEGLTHFRFTEIDETGGLVPARTRPVYWPVYYAEPARENASVLGLDLAANPRRQEVLERAARTREPSASRPLRLAQGTTDELGFLVVLPVGGEGDEATVRGYALAAFQIGGLVQQIFAPLIRRGVQVTIRDQDEADRVFYSAGGGEPAKMPWRFSRTLEIIGRVWEFVFTPTAGFAFSDPEWLRRSAEALQRTNDMLELRVAERTSELEQANAALRSEIEVRRRLEAELAAAGEKLNLLTESEARQWGLAGFIGRSEAFSRVLKAIRSVQAFPRTNVLLTGESGTGKELIARAIHFGSAQATGPFLAVNCSALPAETAEAQLFGHVRGAFPGATGDRKGVFELAHGGTLFLDEIGDMPLSLQSKLLRVLEDGKFTPAGANTSRQASVRVVAATNVNLPEKVRTGAFRQDLYYRLMHFHVGVPPLRERKEDIPALANHFVKLFATDMKRRAPQLRPETLARLMEHDYPGNIRELKNTLERAIIHAGGEHLFPQHIVFAPNSLGADGKGDGPGDPEKRAEQHFAVPLKLDSALDALFEQALAKSSGNVSAAARLLGVNRARYYRWQQRRSRSS